MKIIAKKNLTSKLVQLFIQDSSSTTGAGLTGLVFNSGSLTAYYYREGAASATAISLVTMTVGTWTSGGFKEIDATNMPGWYQLGIPDAALATGASSVDIMLKGATNMVPVVLEIQLSSVDFEDAVRFGLTALPNAAAAASGGLPTAGTGSNQINLTNGNVNLIPADSRIIRNNTAQAGAAGTITLDASASSVTDFYVGTGIKIDSGTGVGQARTITAYNGTSKVATVDRNWATTPDNTSVFTVCAFDQPKLTSALEVTVGGYASGQAPLQPTVAGRTLDVTTTGEAGIDWANIGAPTTTVNLSGTTIATSQVVASVTGAVGSVTGAVGSVTGAVGSVTGNVGGNVVGTVASVVGAVGSVTGNVGGNVTGSVGSVTGNVGGNVVGSVASVTGNVGGNVVGSVGSVTAAVTLAAKDSFILRNGTAQAGAAGTITLDASASSVTDFYIGAQIKIDSGTGSGQVRGITAYNGTSKVVTVDRNWATSPDNTSVFSVIATDSAKLNSSLEVVAASVTGNVGGNVVGNVNGSIGSIASSGISSSSFAPGAITSSSIAGAAITATSIATGAITAAKFAADAIDSSAIAASGASKISAAVWDQTTSGHVTSGTFGQVLAPIRANTAQAGAATTITLDASASATNDLYTNDLITITAGTGVGQTRQITAYNGTSKVATVDTWATNPDNTSVFVIVPFTSTSGSSPSTIAAAVWDLTRTGHSTAGTFGEGVASVQGSVTGSVASVTGNVGGNVTGSVGSVTGNVGGNVTGSVGSVVGAVGSVTAAVTLSSSDSFVIRTNTAQAGSTSAITLDASASAVDNYYRGEIIKIDSGTGAGQTRMISAYVGSTKVATTSTSWATNPDNTSVFTIIADAAPKTNGLGSITVAGYDSGQAPLQPTSAGNTLDVSATGNAGIDWGNIVNATSSVNLANTTIGTVTNAITLSAKDTFSVRSNLAQAGSSTTITLDAGASSVDNFYTGQIIKIDFNTGAGQSRVISGYVGSTKVATVSRAWVTNPDNSSNFSIMALDLPKLNSSLEVVSASVTGNVGGNVTGSVASVVGAVGSVTGNVGGSVASVLGGVGGSISGSVASIGTAGITSTSFAASAITATAIASSAITSAKFATDAIDSNALAASGVSEIAGAVWDQTTSGHTTSGTFGQVVAPIRAGTAQAGAGSTITLDAGANATDSFYNDLLITITSGAGANQTRHISGYVGSTKVASVVPAWVTNPDNTSVFVITQSSWVDVGGWIGSFPNSLISGRLDASVGAYQTGLTPLQPTVAGRTLDVTATGEAGIDWANIGSPTTSVNLSGTTISTSQVVASVTGAVGSVTGAVGSVTGNVGGNVTGSVGSISTGGITASSFAAGAIDAAAIATDAITSAELATSAVTEIAGAVWDITLASHLTAGTTGAALNSAGSAGDPWTTALPGAYSAGSAGYILGTNLDAAVTSRLAPTVSGRTLDVTTTGEAGIDWGNIGSPTTSVNLSGTTISTSQVVASVTGAVGSVTGAVGSVTGNVGGNVTGTVGSVVGAVGSVTGNVGGNVTGSVGSVVGNVGGNVTGSVGSVVAGVSLSAGESRSVRTGTAQAGASTTITLDASANANNGFYNDMYVKITSGTGAGQVRLISGYTGATKVVNILPAWVTNPDNTSVFTILDGGYTDVGEWLSITPNALISGRVDSSVGAYQSGLTPLQPTVSGRTLDVTATGEAGIDWANIGSPTTTVNLSGTTISTSQTITSVSGSVGSVTGAVGSVTGAVGSVTGNVGGNVTGSVGSIATGGITSSSIATDAITSTGLAASAASEIAAAVWDLTRTGHSTAGTFGEGVASVQGNVTGSVASVVGAVGSVTGNVGGNVVGSVGSVTAAITLSAKDSFVVRNGTAQAGAAGTITLDASANATDNFYNGTLIKIDSGTGVGQTRVIATYVGSTKVATLDRNWVTNPDNTSVFTIVSTDSAKLNSSLEVVAASVSGNVSGSVASVVGAVGSVTGNVGGNVTGSVGSIASGGITSSSFAASAITATSIASSAITAAKFATDAIDSNALAATAVTEIQTGLATSSAQTTAQTSLTDIQGRLPAALVSGRIDASVGAYQTGQAPLQPTVAGRTLDVTTTGEAGIDWANIGSPTTTVNLSGTTISTSQVVASVTGAVGSVTGAVGSVTGSVGSVTGNVGGNVVGSVASVSGNVGGNVTGSVGSIATGGITSTSFSAGAIDAAAIATDAITSAELATSAITEIAGAVWDITLASHLTGGTTGAALNAAGSAGDPWATALPGAYSAGSAGFILGTNLDTTVTSRLAPTVAGRTLDVSAGGEAGLDWANIGSPTTTVNLSGTTISTSQTIASVSGAVGSVTGAVGSVTGNVGGNVTGSVGSVVGAITLATKDSFVIRNSTAQAGASTTITLDASASATDNFYNGTLVKIDSGTGVNQVRVITGYVGSTKVATVDRAWVTNPDNTSVFTVVASESAKLNSSLEVVSASVTGNVSGSVASVVGAVGSVTGNVGGNVTGSVGSVVGAVGSVTGNVGGNVTGSVGSIASGGITSSSFAASAITATSIASAAITAAKFATDAIDSNALAASAVTEIQSGLATSSAISAIQADTDDIQTRLPAALVSGRMDVSVGAYQTGLTPLQPTTAGRTLDVSATGEAGIDWANIGSPTTSVNLSGTTISTSQSIASVSGAVGSVTGAVGSVTGSVGSVVGAVGSVTGNVGGNVTGSVGSIATGGITSSSFAAGAIDAAAIATDAITSVELASSAVTEIAGAVWEEARASHTTSGSFGQGVSSVQGNVTGSVASVVGNVGGNVTGSVGSVINDIGGDILGDILGNVSGNVIGSIGSVATGGITSSSFATDSITATALAASATSEIAGGVWDEATSGHVSAGSFGQAVQSSLRAGTAQAGSTNTITLDAGASSSNSFYNDQIIRISGGTGANQSRVISAYNGTSKVATVSSNWVVTPDNTSTFVIQAFGVSTASTPSAIATAVWEEATSAHTTAGTFGQSQQPVRAGTAQGGGSTTITLDSGASGSNSYYNDTLILITGGTGAGQTRGITNYVGSTKVATVTSAWVTNPDNTSVFVIYPFAFGAASSPSTIASAVWDLSRSGHTNAGSFGEGVNSVQGNVTGSVASVVGDVGGNVVGTVDSVVGDVGGNVTGSVGSVLGNVNGNVTGSIGSVATGGITAASFATDAITNTTLAASAITEIQSGLATASAVSAIQSDTDDIQTRLPASLISGRLDVSVGAYQSGLAPLQPTTAGRTLDVTATGAAGIDWGNVENPTTSLNLSGTTISTAQTITSVSGSVGSVTGAVGSVTGSVGSVTGNIGGNVTGSVGSVIGAVGSVTGDLGGNVTGSVGSIATGGITASSFATDSITSTALAATAVTEIQTGLATASALATAQSDIDTIISDIGAVQTAVDGVQTTVSGIQTDVGSVLSDIASVQSDTNDIQTRLPVSLVGGRMASDAVAISGSTTAADNVEANISNLDATVSSRLAASSYTSAPTSSTIADAVWDEILSGHAVSGSTGEALSAAGASGDPWITALPGSYSAGQAGYIVGTNIDALISSRLASVAYTAPDNATIGTINTKLGTPVSTVSADIAGIQSDTNDIQTRLPAALVGGRMVSDAVAISGSTIAADAVESNIANLDATISSRAAAATALSNVQWTNARAANLDNLDEAISTTLAAADYVVPPTVGAIADAVWDEPIASHANAGSTGESLTNAGTPSLNPTDISDAVWNAARTSYTVSGSFGQGVASVAGNVTGSVASVAGNVGGNVVGNVNGSVASVAGDISGNVNGYVASLGMGADTTIQLGVQTVLENNRLDQLLVNQLNAAPGVGSVFGDLLQDAGGGVYQFTTQALENAPSGGGGGTSDWTATEKAQIRFRLGLDGSVNTPTATPDLAYSTDVTDILDSIATVETNIGTVNTNVGAINTKIGTPVGTVSSDIAGIQTDTNDIQSRLPAALVGGRMASDAVAISGSTIAADNVETNITNLDATVSTRAPASTALSTAQWTNTRATKLDNADVATSTRLASSSYTAPTTPPSVAAIVNGVWDEPISGHLTAGSTGLKLSSASAAGDPWGTPLPGSYLPGEAGYILGNMSGGGSGGTDWTDEERKQIRYRLGLDGVSAKPNAVAHIVVENANNVVSVVNTPPVPSTQSVLSLYSPTTFEAVIKGADLTGYTKLWFTAKVKMSLYDKDALIQMNSDDGLVYINGKVAADASAGSVVVADSTIVLTLDHSVTIHLPESYNVPWDIKKITPSGSSVIANGVMNIRKTTTITNS